MKVLVQITDGNRVEIETRNDTLHTLIKAVLTKANISEAEFPLNEYALQIESTKYYLEETDIVRYDFSLPSGSILLLKLKPSISAMKILRELKESNNVKLTIHRLKGLLKEDVMFSYEFLKQEGLSAIITIITDSTGNALAYALNAFEEAMNYCIKNLTSTSSPFVTSPLEKHLIPNLSSLSFEFIVKLVTYLYLEAVSLNVCRSALNILYRLLYNSDTTKGLEIILSAFKEAPHTSGKPPLRILVELLESTNLYVQLSSLKLINTILSKHSDSKDQLAFIALLDDLNICSSLKKSADSSDSEFRKQLYIYQTFKMKEIRMLKESSYQKDSQEHEAMLMRLWQATFPNTALESRVSEQWKMLGFQGTDPATDFRGMGLLGLHNLLYFAENHSEIFRAIVTEQAGRKERDFPVAVAGINITGMLVELFKITNIGISAVEANTEHFQLFSVLFDHPKAFEEIYCIAFRVLESTWDEMVASYMDFPRVIAAVRKRMTDVIELNPRSLEQFDAMATQQHPALNLSDNIHGESGIGTGLVSAAEIDDSFLTNDDPEPVRALRSNIKDGVLKEIIRQQKVMLLQQGTTFRVYKPKAKQPPFNFFRLLTNREEFFYGPAMSVNEIPSELPFSFKLSDCNDLICGNSSPLFSKQKKISAQDEDIVGLSFTLQFKEAGKSIEFLACNREDYVNWTDGLRILLQGRIENKETADDLKSLVSLEVRIKMLDLEGSQIPDEAPKIPSSFPDNLNFSCV